MIGDLHPSYHHDAPVAPGLKRGLTGPQTSMILTWLALLWRQGPARTSQTRLRCARLAARPSRAARTCTAST